LPEAKLPLHRGVYEPMVRDHNDGTSGSGNDHNHVDAPLGSGLGSSSALVVAQVDAFRALLGAPLGQYDVARESNFSWLRTADTVIFARDRLPLVRSCALQRLWPDFSLFGKIILHA
jgi:hypothetical protein